MKVEDTPSLQVGDWVIYKKLSLYDANIPRIGYIQFRDNEWATIIPDSNPGLELSYTREILIRCKIQVIGHGTYRWWHKFLTKNLKRLIHPYSKPKDFDSKVEAWKIKYS